MPIRVTVVYSPRARTVHEVVLQLDVGSTAGQALESSGLRQLFPELVGADFPIGIWGRKVAFEQVLVDEDRVEVYRALTVDPKSARRARFAAQGARSAGLFARRRPGAKAGY